MSEPQPPKTGKTNLDVFAQTALELAQADRDVLVVTSDSRGSGKLVPYSQALPAQIIETGIAEQNLVGIAAGLASTGKKVFAVSPASFLTARSFEQVKNDVGYSNQPVKLVGISAGVSYGALGYTHHSTHDFAAMLGIHNIDIVVPADNFETRAAVRAAAARNHPVYLRFGKKAMPEQIGPSDVPFEIGKARVLAQPGAVTIIATGETVWPAWQARELLELEGISCGVISLHSLRPLDIPALTSAAKASSALLTVEEHAPHGGLGSLVATTLMQAGIFLPFRMVSLPDEPVVTGSQGEVFGHYGITAQGLRDAAVTLLRAQPAV
jgi:transketolase